MAGVDDLTQREPFLTSPVACGQAEPPETEAAMLHIGMGLHA